MTKFLSVTKMHEILSQCEWTPGGKLRVLCTHKTQELIEQSGVYEPRALTYYEVDVRRDEEGFLVLNPFHKRPVSLRTVPDDSLFAGASDAPAALPAALPAAPTEVAEELDLLTMIARMRTFEIAVDCHRRIRVEVVALEDESLPSPNERERWKIRKASDVDIHAAISALYMSRQIAGFERI